MSMQALKRAVEAMKAAYKAIDRGSREIDDALCDAILVGEREIAASTNARWVLVPTEPSEAHLASMGMRHRHDYDLLPENHKASIRTEMRQLYEEAVGEGFFKLDRPAEAPVAWETDHPTVCGSGITRNPSLAASWRAAGYRVTELWAWQSPTVKNEGV